MRASPGSIRRVESADVELLAELESAAFDPPWSRESLSVALSAQGAEAWLAGRDAYALFRTVAGEAELLRIAVRPDARRRGLARALLESGLGALAEGGVEVVHLEVRSDNAAALALYRATGFRPLGSRRRYYPGGADAVLMRRG